MAWYAWSNISTGKDVAGRPVLTPAGSEVTAKSLGVTKEQFAQLVAGGSIRSAAYPPIVAGSTLSPTQYMKRQVAISEGSIKGNIMDGVEVLKPLEFQAPDNASDITLPPGLLPAGIGEEARIGT